MSTERIVTPGSVWADCDPRQVGRTLRVDRLATVQFGSGAVVGRVPVALCTVLTNRDGDRRKPGRRVEIRVSRFRPYRNGYRLVTPAPESGEVGS